MTIFGQGQPHGSVPNVRPPEVGSRPVWNSGQVLQQAQSPGQYRPGRLSPDQYRQEPYGHLMARPRPPMGGGGGSFLGTAAAAAAGVVGGSLLLGSIRSMMGGSHHSFGDQAAIGEGRQPKVRGAINPAAAWRATPASTISVHRRDRADDNSRSGLFDSASNDDDRDDDHDDMDLDSDDFGGDGDSDYA